MSDDIKQNQTKRPLPFLMIDSTDSKTGKTGLTPTVTISKNGLAFHAPVGAVSEVGNGWYQVAPNATDSDTLGPLILHAEAAGADPCDQTFNVVSNYLGASVSDPDRVASSTAYYGAVNYGDVYWLSQLGGNNWKEAIDSDKILALGSATRLIDRLRFRDAKAVSSQLLQFPRGTDTSVPLPIEYAAYEIAECLLGGDNVELMVRNLSVQQTSFGGPTLIRAANAVPDHLAAGIPSLVAWSYLLPYLQARKFVKRSS